MVQAREGRMAISPKTQFASKRMEETQLHDQRKLFILHPQIESARANGDDGIEGRRSRKGSI